ncbi:gamma-glutamyl-gamma-aminobutyrate hydrolase family protein [Parvibaculum sp.]|uniref:gamma-glutamyl-gamma-aminobutyrate hydrolase family protein n=1 Tax=Parvibaculum sp. TaxID=2024848 RepID=UPI00391ACB2E
MTRKSHRRPIIGIPCDVKMLGPHPFHAVGEKYIAAVEGGAGGQPVLLPVPRATPGEPFDSSAKLDDIFALCDGIFLTGSHSNVHPENYGGTPPREGVLIDRQRDALTLALIRECVARAVPLFAVCRGFQELNVAFGGTLHQHIEETGGEPGFAPRLDHREKKDDPLEIQYGPAHDVALTPGGAFEKLLGTQTIRVNSLHGQGIARLADGLVAEGRAPDGTVEAVRVKGAAAFALGVQWHPEWKYWENPVSQKLFGAFGDAVRQAASATA